MCCKPCGTGITASFGDYVLQRRLSTIATLNDNQYCLSGVLCFVPVEVGLYRLTSQVLNLAF